MKRVTWWKGMVVVLGLTLMASCGGGGGAAPTGTLLGPDGSEVTSLDVSAPVAAGFANLSANSQYTVRTVDPNGNTVCTATVYTDNDGTIPDSPYCYLRDRDTSRFTTDGEVNAMVIKADGIDAVFAHGKAVTTGDYTLEVFDSDGEEVLTKSADFEDVPLTKAFAVTSTAARTCASNSSGACARSFLKDVSNVYVTIEQGDGVPEGSVVDIYVVSDRCSVGYPSGAALQDVSPDGANVGVTVNYTGGLFTTGTPVWANPASAGMFDVVVDVDRSGTYTAGDLVEILDQTPADANNPGGLCAVGFAVQDAYSDGTDVIMQIAMDQNRAYQDVFAPGISDVFAQVQSMRRLVHKFGVRKYVVVHQNTWTDGDVLTDVIPYTLDEVQTGCTNQQRRLVAPINLLSPGCYDVVFDVDGDGVYDRGGDAVDNIDLDGANTCGFIVAQSGLVTIDTIVNVNGENVKDGTNNAISAKVTITGSASEFGSGATVKGYAVHGSQQGGSILGTLMGGAFTITDMPLLSGTNRINVLVTEGVGTANAKFGYATATVIWNPGGSAGDIDFLAVITWLSLTDMDTHFIKTAGTYTGRTDAANTADCHYANCTQDSNEALDWTTTNGSQTTSNDTSTGAIARLDLDCIGCEAKTETAWIMETSEVVPKEGNLLLCVVAFSGTDTPSANVSINGVAQIPLTAPSSIDSSSGNDMWFAGYLSQDANGNITWHAVNAVGVGANVCKQP